MDGAFPRCTGLALVIARLFNLIHHNFIITLSSLSNSTQRVAELASILVQHIRIFQSWLLPSLRALLAFQYLPQTVIVINPHCDSFKTKPMITAFHIFT
jgi:hypothetical protein